MHVRCTILVVVGISILAASCAHKGFVIPDDPIDRGVIGAVPHSVDLAITKFNNKDYTGASLAWQNVLSGPDAARFGSMAEYYLAESLFRMELIQASQYFFQSVLLKGPSGAYFAKSLDRLFKIAKFSKDESSIPKALQSTAFADLPPNFKDEVLYLMGKYYFRQGQLDRAKENFSSVVSESDFFPDANYYLGIIAVKEKQYKEAVLTFKKVAALDPGLYSDPDSVKKVQNLANLATGQIYYGLRYFPLAIHYYSKVNRRHHDWPEALFEMAWATFMKGRFNDSLGIIHALHSPYFKDRFQPETELLAAINYLNLCKHDPAKKIIDHFKETYVPMEERLNRFITDQKNRPPELLYTILVEILRGKDPDRLPAPIVTFVFENATIRTLHHMIGEVEREIRIIKRLPENWKRSSMGQAVFQKLMADRVEFMKSAGILAQKEIAEAAKQLTDLRANAITIEFETANAEKEWLEARRRGVIGAGGRKVSFSAAVPDNYEFWIFSGEYWWDELGYYKYNLVAECP
ncbi:MAG: hypothetical protein GXP49_05690 [Deltaproteobacteria bacterium]|nr:hypothetical protein [Deltaproteobacteria bacterium]